MCMQANRQHGQGEYKSKEYMYVGEWRSGVRHGQGVIGYAGGNKYEGAFANDLMDGFGIFTGICILIG